MSMMGVYDNASVELSGDRTSIVALANELRGAKGTRELALAQPTGSIEPYLGHLSSIVVTTSPGRVSVAREHRKLMICGSSESLAILAQNLEFLANQDALDEPAQGSPHLHIEYYPGDSYLVERAIPLVVTRTQGD
jgi:hypothetical protein